MKIEKLRQQIYGQLLTLEEFIDRVDGETKLYIKSVLLDSRTIISRGPIPDKIIFILGIKFKKDIQKADLKYVHKLLHSTINMIAYIIDDRDKEQKALCELNKTLDN